MRQLYLRAYITTRFLLSLNATEIHNELNTAFGHDAVSYRTVSQWVNRLFSGRESLEDDPRQGCPITVITQ